MKLDHICFDPQAIAGTLSEGVSEKVALLETNKENTEKNVMLCGRIAEDAVAATEGGTEEKTAEEVSQLVI